MTPFASFLLVALAFAEDSPAHQLTALAKEGFAIRENFSAELKAAKDDKALSEANRKYRADAKAWAARANPLLNSHPSEPAALDVVPAMKEISYVDDRVVQIVRENHFKSPKVLGLVFNFCQDGGVRRLFAEDIAEKHPDRAIRGQATLILGRMDRVYLIDGLQENPSFGGRLGKPDELRVRARRYLERVLKNYSDVMLDEEGETLGELSKDELAGLGNLGRLEVGNVAPDIEGKDLDGKPLKLTMKSGRVTLLVFWGTWCRPCMRLVPGEVAMLEKYKAAPFQIYGINGGDEREVAKKTTLEKQMTWPNFYGTRKRGGLAAVWNVDNWPRVWVIGPDGVILYKGSGNDLEETVEKAVASAKKGDR